MKAVWRQVPRTEKTAAPIIADSGGFHFYSAEQNKFRANRTPVSRIFQDT
jgi:hypothetical protein